MKQILTILFMLVGMAPLRISFSGGGTDMPEYYEKYGGCVVTTNINRFTYVIINPRHDNSFQAFSSDFETHQETTSYETLEPKHGTEIAVTVVKQLNYRTGGDFLICSDVRPGSGLGASSTLAVNYINTISTLKGESWSKERIAETAFNIERNILNHPIGKQDDYISSFGGFNFIKFEKEKIEVMPINLNKQLLSEFEQNLLLFFVGNTRNSATILSKQLDNIKQNDKQTIDSLHSVKLLAEELYSYLKKSDITKIGEVLHKGWLAKKKFAEGVSNDQIDKIYDAALKSGAVGGKLTGAGGGGHMLLYCETTKQKAVIEKMESLGLTNVPLKFHSSGPKVLNLYDYSK